MSRPANILVITYWPLDNALITTYTLPYVRLIRQQLSPGSRVWLMTLSHDNFRKSAAFDQISASLRKEGIESVDFGYRAFGARMLFSALGIFSRLRGLCRSRNITHIHAWCTPGGAIGYVLSVLTGKPLILDSFEPHAETMVETGNWKKSSMAFRLLWWLEKKQAQRARHIISAAPGMIAYAVRKYGIKKREELVKPACVDLAMFRPFLREERTLNGFGTHDVICVYAGKFGGIYLERETFDFFAAAAAFWGERFKVLLLTSHTKDEIDRYCSQSGFDKKRISMRFVPHNEVPQYIGAADFAICPVKPVPTKKYCSPIKNGEYWACGLPVVITDHISNDSLLIHEQRAGYVLRYLDRDEYLRAAAGIDSILREKDHKGRIRNIAERHRNFSIAEKIYRLIYA